MEIPTTEPSTVTAGDTVTWLKSLSDYPASGGWSLAYRLINSAGKIDIAATASGADHLVSVAAATTESWLAGDYDYIATVTKAAERYTVGNGRITVAPNLAALTTYDGRSIERKALEALESAYLDYLTNHQGHVQEYEIAGRRMKFRSAAEIWDQISRLRAEVRKQDDAAAMAAGINPKRRVMVRFNS